MERKHAADYDPELLDLYDGYVHGQISRRDFLSKASKYAIGGLTSAALLDSLMPNYAFAEQWLKTISALQPNSRNTNRPKAMAKCAVISSDLPRQKANCPALSSCTKTAD